MKEDNMLYLVLRLLQDVEYENPLTRQAVSSKLEGCHGYLPVFNNLEDAKKEAENGKYKIYVVEAIESETQKVKES